MLVERYDGPGLNTVAGTRQDKTLFTLGPLLNGVGGIYTKYLSKTRDKMVEKHITKYLKIQINI